MMFFKLSGTALVMSLGLIMGASATAQQGPPPATVRLAEIVERDMTRTITTPASVVSRFDARIAAETTGRIVSIAEPGDIISEGEAIAQMDDRQARIALEDARASHSRARVNSDYQAAEYDRISRLVSNGTLPETRLREVTLERDLAVQTLRAAESALSRARLELDRTQIRAPFTGRVAERLIQLGELSTSGRDIVRLVDVERKEAVAQAPVAIAPYLQTGQTVFLSLADGTQVEAPIRAIIPVGHAVSRTFEVRIDLAGSDWIVGSAARAAFPAETPRTQLAAPQDSLVLRAGGAHLFIVDDENIAHQVPVIPGVRENGFIAVEGELNAGDRVVVSGAETLSDGRTVQEIVEAG